MKLSLYSIYDTVACIFNKPFSEVNNATAIRAYENSIQDSPNVNDYNLYLVAYWDDNSGEINPLEPEKVRIGFDISSKRAQDEIPSILKRQSGV